MTKPNPDDYFGDSKGEATAKPKGKRSINPDDYFGPIEPPKPKAEKPPGLIKRGLAALANGRGVDEVDAGGGTAPVLQDGQESAAPVDDIGGGRGRVNPEPARADSRRGGTPTTLRSGAYVAGMEEAPTAPSAGELLETPRADFQPSQADLEWQSLSPAKQQEILARGAQRGSPGAVASEPGVGETIAANVRDFTSNPVARGAVAGFSQLGRTGVGAVRGIADAVGADGVADFAAGASGKATQIGTGATRDLKEGNDKLTALISSSILNSAPSLAMGVAGGPALRTLFAQSALAEYNSGRDAGFSPAESATRAGIMGLAESLGERFGLPQQIALLKSVAKHVPTGELAKTFGSMIAREIPGEQLTTAMQFLADKLGPAALNPNASLADYLSQAGETLKVTIGQTAVMGGGPAAIGAVRDTYAKSDRATATPEQILAQAIDQAAAQFGLNTKAAATLREKIASMDPDTATNYAEKVFAAAERSGLVKKPGGGSAVRQNAKDLAAKAAKDAEAQRGDASGDSVPAGAAASSDTGLADDMDAGAILGTQAEAPQATSGEAPTGDGTDAVATDQAQPGVEAGAAPPIEGEPINKAWSAFTPESGTLNIPREQMPQVDAEHRGALVQFLGARGITHESAEVPADSLKPTQAEFSPKKVEHFAGNPSGRSILVSQDGYVLDGHHQWMAKRAAGEPVKVIRLNAPIQDLLRLTHQFPSSTTSKGPRNVVSGTGSGPQPGAGGNAQPGSADASGSGGTVDVVQGELPQPGAAGTAGASVPGADAGDRPAATGHGAGNEALKPGQSVTIDGKPYTVKSAKPKVLVLTGADGKPRTITSDSATWAKVQPAEARQEPGKDPATTGPRTLGKIGRTPNAAETVELRPNKDGTLTPYQGKYAMVDYETGEPVVVPADATNQQAIDAIKKSGAMGAKDKWFGVQKEQPNVVQGNTPESQAKPDQEGAPAGGVEPAGAAAAPAVPAAGSPEVEADGVKPAGPVIQNRDRSTPAAITQMRGIAANPDYLRLSSSRDFTAGAPVIVGSIPLAQMGRKETMAAGKRRIPGVYAVVEATDLVASNSVDGSANPAFEKATTKVIAGNGRTAGLQEAYRTGKAAGYRAELEADESHGINPDVIRGMKAPVLVRVMPTSEITDDIGDISNTQAGLQLSAVEQARNDANRVDLDALEFTEDGRITPDTVRRFVQAMPQAEQGSLINRDGSPTAQAVDRLNAVVFFKAYNSEPLTNLYAQTADPDARNIMGALAQAATSMARLEGAGALDIRPLIAEAAEIAINGRRNGLKLSEIAAQDRLDADPDTRVILTLFANNANKVKPVADALKRAADFAYAEANKPAEDMFGSVSQADRGDVVSQIGPRDEARGAQNLEDQARGKPAGRDAERRVAEGPGQGNAGATEEGASAAQAEGLTLTSETEADAQAKAKREADALAAEQKAKADEQARLKREANKREADARAAAILAEREAAKKAEVDAAAEDFALGQEPPKPVDKKVVAKDLAGQKDIFSAPEPTRIEDGDSEAIRQAKADLMASMGDLANLLGKNTRLNILPEQEQALMPVLARAFDAAFRLGHLKFKAAARFVLNTIRTMIGDDAADSITLDHLQGAYISMAGKYKDQGAEKARDVTAVESLDEIVKAESTPAARTPTPADGITRAVAGGQEGINGAWYEGGQILPSSEDTVQGAQTRQSGPRAEPAVDTSVPTSPAASLAGAGLVVEHKTAQSGKSYWAVSGNTREHEAVLDALGFGKPFKMGNKRYRSVRDGDPTERLAAALQGNMPTPAAPAAELPSLPADEAAAVLRQFKVEVSQSGDQWVVTGKTFDIKDTIKATGGRWNGQAWAYSKDPAGTLAHALKERGGAGTAGDDTGAGDSDAEIARRRELRQREDARADERADAGNAAELVGGDTQDLIRRGAQFNIPAKVLADQIEDVGLIVNAHAKGKPLFLLANEAGTGKTMVLGGAIRELRKRGEGKFVYVTMNTDLIAQIQKDLADYGVDDVKFHTYSELSTKDLDTDGAILIFDEAHNVKNVGAETARANKAQDLMARAKMNVLASATLFENPVEARYLASTGIFDGVGGFSEWAKMYGASVKVRKFYNPNTGQQQTEEIIYWAGRGKKEDGAAARQWLFKQAIMTQRAMMIDPKMVAVQFRRNAVDQQWVDLYSQVVDAYDAATDAWTDDSGQPRDAKIVAEISRHRENTIKRILEASKIPFAIAEAKELLAAGRNVVIFVETKADRTLGMWRRSEHFKDDTLYTYSQMQELMAEWELAKGMARMQDERAPPRPFAEFIVEIARFFDAAGVNRELPSTSDQITEALGADKVAIYTGAVTNTAAGKNKADFMSGRKPVLVATMAKGGTGLSLHDTKGNRPTTQLNINLPWKATGVDQVSARVARYGLASNAEVRWLFASNIPWESQKLAPRVGARMRDMGAIVKGIEVKAAEILDGQFDFEGNIDAKGGSAIKAASESGDIYARAKRMEALRRKADDTSNGFFETPYPLAALMAQIGGVRPGTRLLEPSAGRGNLLRLLPDGVNITAVELRQDNREALARLVPDAAVIPGDFMEADFGPAPSANLQDQGRKFDTVLMNPPFERVEGVGAQDVAHVMRAYRLLDDGGRLVAIMGEGAFFRDFKQEKAFRQWLDDVGATVIQMPEGAFKQSGTGVRTRMVVIDKGGEAGRSDINLADMEIESLRDVERRVPSRAAVSAAEAALPAETVPAEPVSQEESEGPTPNYKAGDQIVPDKDVIEGDIVRHDGGTWMAKVKRGNSIPLLPIASGVPQVNADSLVRVDLTENKVTHTGLNFYGYGGQTKFGESMDVPPEPLRRLKRALDMLRDIERRLAGVQRARGDGHTLALEVLAVKDDIRKYTSDLDAFRSMAANNGVNVDAVIKREGGVPDLARFGKPASIVTPQVPVPAAAPAPTQGARVRFTPTDASPLGGGVVEGVVFTVDKTSGGAHRVRIRTDIDAPQGGGKVERLVYTNAGTFEELPEPIEKPAAAAVVQQAETLPQAKPEELTQDAPEESEAQETAESEKIANFGEKIGGSRADTAKPLGKRMTKEKDDRPAWARKYHAMPAAGTRISLAAMMSGQPQEAQPGDRWQLFAGEGSFVQPVSRTIYPSEQAALDAIPLVEVSRKHRVYAYKEGEKILWGIFRKMGDRKRTMVKGGFESEEAGMLALVADPVSIIEHKFAFPERPWLDNVERIGPARRTGNVTPTQFNETFGFRGGEFGKWNEGGDGQDVLNHAYDGLLDLADVLGLPPKAMSLNGELAIAFGARGKGGLKSGAAHYERDYEVMNLTKMQGAGSLAHEWFHALDHYLSRLDGKAFSTFTTNERGDRVRVVTKEADGNYLSHGALRKSNMRPELLEAFGKMIAALHGKPRQVPINVERIEKSVKSSAGSLDYRLNDLRGTIADGRYNRSKKTATPAQLAQWDALAERLRQGDLGEAKHIEAPSSARFSMGRQSTTVIVEMNGIYKAVTGRSFDKTGYDSIGNAIKQEATNLKALRASLADATERAARGEMATITQGSDYATNAREIDSGRVSPYWSTPHEMGARAFEAYIMDRIAERAGRSDYLVYGAENSYYALFGMKPYPEGDERRQINAAFDALFKTVEAKETDKGVALLSQAQPFYSALSRAIESVAMKQGTAGAWGQFLKGMVANGKVKADELEWSGLSEWLNLQPGKVTKEQLLDYLAANGVQVTETMLRDGGATDLPPGWRVIEQDADDANFPYALVDEAGEVRGEGHTYADALSDGWDADSAADAPTKYSNYTLPGGTNYREILLTLPAKPDTLRAVPHPDYTGGDFALAKPDGSYIMNPRTGRPMRWDSRDLAERYGKRTYDEARQGQYQSAHWTQPNVLAHIRVNDRVDATGARVLFVEEIQSDWAQEGKKKGFASESDIKPVSKREYDAFIDKLLDDYIARGMAAGEDRQVVERRGINMLLPQMAAELGRADEYARMRAGRLLEQSGDSANGVPPAPFIDKTDKWVALALKRVIKMAVDGGYDRVAFVTGEQSAERYDLSKQVDNIRLFTRKVSEKGAASSEPTMGRLVVSKGGDSVLSRDVEFSELPDLIGKEAAQKLIDAEKQQARGGGGVGDMRELSGLDLKVGGEGMRAFYDKIVPAALKDVLKKVGGEPGVVVSITSASSPYPKSFASRAEAEAWAEANLGDHDFTVRGLSQSEGTFSVYDEYDHRFAPANKTLTQPGFDITPAMRAKAADGLPLFKTKASTTGTDPGKLTAMVANIRAGWADAPPVEVVATTNDLPANLVAELRRARAFGTARALIVPNTGKVYLIADRLESLADAQFVLFHEVLGHYGLRKFLGADYEKTMRQMRAMNAGLAAESRSWMAEYGPGQIEARVKRGMSYAEATVEVDLLSVEEALSDRAGKPEQISGFKRLVAKLQAWLREHGFMEVAKWLEGKTQAQVLSLLQSARDAVEKADGVHAYTGGAMVAASQMDQTQTPEFRKWFGKSAVVDADGKPMVVYHGTTSDFTRFDLQRGGAVTGAADAREGFFFASNPKAADQFTWKAGDKIGNIMPVYLSMQNPAYSDLVLTGGNGRAAAMQIKNAKAAGHDGIIFRDSDMLDHRGQVLVAFRPEQIKSATGNSGAFDPSNPSILLSQHTPEQREALKRAGIAPKRRMKDNIRSAWEAAAGLIADRTDLAQGARQAMLDQFYGIQRAVQRDVGNLPLEQDPYVTARLANGGTSSVMRALLLHGQAQWAANGQHLEKKPGTVGLLDILKPLGDDLNDWFGWMIGNRAARLFKEGRENNFTEDQIKALQALGTPEKIAEFRKAALQYAAFKRSVLDVAEAAGLINKETRPAWDNADYIPFYRQIDEKATFSATGKKGLAGQSSGIRTLKGGESALHDPIENLLMNFSRLIDASLKNNALSRTVRVLEDAGSTALSKTGYTMSAEIVPRSQIEKALADAGTPDYILAGLPPEAFEGMAKMWAIQPPTDPSVIRIMRGGKPQFYKVHDPLLLKAATSFVPFDFPGLGVMRAFKRVLTAMVTSTPEFMLRNFIRDSAAVQGIARTGVNPAKSLSGIVRAFKEDGAAEHMLFAGASFQSGNTNAADPTGTATSIRRALRQKGMDAAAIDGFMATIVDKPARLWELYKHVGEAIENANREAIFEATAKKGSVTAAAYEAKDLMDFSLRGSHPIYQLAADVLPFFNARVQGLYRVGRSNPGRLAVYAGIMAVLSVALVMANSGEDWYDELPDWDKDAYWHFMLFGTHYRLPKPFELGVAFATIPERIARYLDGQDSGSKTVGRLFANVRDQLAFDPIPQAIRPAMNAWANKDTFRGAPIENIADEGKLPHARYSATTSPTARLVTDTLEPATDAIGLSPKKLEYLIGGYLGTVGTYALGAADMAVRELQDAPAQPAPRLDDLPIVKAFVREAPARSTVYENDLYEVRDRIEKIYRSAAAKAKEGNIKGAKADLDKYKPEMKARGTVLSAAATLAGIRREREKVYADRAMTPEAKRERLDELQVMENKAVKKAMTDPKVKALQ